MIKFKEAKQPVQGSKSSVDSQEKQKKKKQERITTSEPEFPLQSLNPAVKKGGITEIRLVSLHTAFDF